MDFLSAHPSPDVRDYFHPTFIGTVETFFYPALIAANEWTVIGGWIGLKVAARWKDWIELRSTYNRFLIGNLVSVAVSAWLAQYLEVIKL